MTDRILAAAFMLLITWSSAAVSDVCYTVEGEVKTVNISAETQVGSISLQLYDENDDEVFNETGSLIGMVTGGGFGYTILNHIAEFSDGSVFSTSGDLANITDIIKYSDNVPCAFGIREVISNVAGTGIFAEVSNVLINADGYVDTCIAEGDNENEFELSGSLCVGAD